MLEMCVHDGKYESNQEKLATQHNNGDDDDDDDVGVDAVGFISVLSGRPKWRYTKGKLGKKTTGVGTCFRLV